MTGRPPRPSATAGQVIRLGALVVVLAALLAYRFWPATSTPPASDTTPAASAADTSAPGTAPGGLPLPAEVRLGTLDRAPAISGGDRNPFAFGMKPVPLPPPQVRPRAPESEPPPAPRPQGPPPIELRLMGVTIVPGDGRSMATLTEPGTNGVYQAFEGDVVDGRFRVVRVGVQSVVLSYLDGSGTRTIPLGG